ncbi:MAG: HD domain-containing protein [Nitrososphaerota archaeon]|nr:HD domain-containing protein [Nitrososphaerota archaeon]MDG6903808.1 HD domain-containing protein [Nitrososphaerota archaeon]MDG6911558.1 HD domain-containing protein [Nitrososphaerota archaeon]MDG6940463.1 HD domain-containing protein [Nitrososphaerota archaeon]MDG6960773.1 HD domain-containing protein [Nitrososphaerota archaeon]
MTTDAVAKIRDPVHGYIRMTEVERELIDSPFLQRLRRVHQLAGSYMVYPGATHTRFEHVVGTMHVAGQVAESLTRSYDVSKDMTQEVRVAALLHDVGHGPFSHMYEEVLDGKAQRSHEEISRRVILETTVSDILERNGYSSKKMSDLAVGRARSKEPFMNEIVAGGLSADMMDYLPRDSYFTGVEYGKVDIQRVIDSMRVVEGHLVIDDTALYAFEALLLARYEMFKAVYFHKTVRAAELMLVRSMQLADSVLGLTNLSDMENYLELTDEVVLHRLVTLEPSNQELREARRLALGFRDRRLVKCAFERVMQRMEGKIGKIFVDQAARSETVSLMAKDTHVSPEALYLDVPTTPSVPNTYSKEVFRTIGLLSMEENKQVLKSVPLTKLPLVGSIAGFMDVLRVYTTSKNRKGVAKVANKIFNDKRFLARMT